jgi:hypothetical protein
LKARWVFICGALLLLLANSTYGNGAYRRTKDRRTFVWDNDPKPNQTATWSGERDADGYAMGTGTLTWYTVERKILTGSNIPDFRYTVMGSFTGNMVRGKFNGPVVDLDPDGNKFHAKFVDGRRASDWAAGPAPETKKQVAANDEQRDESIRRAELVETPAPAEEPSSVSVQEKEVSDQPPARQSRFVGAKSETSDRSADQPVPERAAKETSNAATDDSLESLISVPSFLRMSARGEARPKASVPPTVSSSPSGPHLTEAQVIGLADAEARARGYNLDEYRRPQPQYTDETWSVSYDSKSVDANGMGGVGKHFSVTVEDKTKKTSITAGK